MAGGREPLCHADPGGAWHSVWRIRLHKAVFNCAVIVYLHSALYSSTLFLDGHLSAERQGFWLLHGKPQTELSAIVTEQRALELVRGGEVKFFSLSLSPLQHAGIGRGGWSPPMSLHVCVCAWVSACVCVAGCTGCVKRMRVVCSIGSKGLSHVSGHCLPWSHFL